MTLPRSVAAALATVAVLATGGCGGDDEPAAEPTSAGPTASAAEVAAVSSDVKNAATAMEAFYVDNAGSYAVDVAALDLTSASQVEITQVDDDGFALCAFDASSGAWASFVSDTGALGSGDTGAACP